MPRRADSDRTGHQPAGYAYNEGAPYHEAARRWWEGLVNGSERVGLPWVVSTGFVRLMTHPRALTSPMSPADAIAHVRNWFRYAHVTPINPGAEHLTHVQRNLDAAGVGANLVTDAHIAALAVEYQAEVHSNDSDFSRFPHARPRRARRSPGALQHQLGVLDVEPATELVADVLQHAHRSEAERALQGKAGLGLGAGSAEQGAMTE